MRLVNKPWVLHSHHDLCVLKPSAVNSIDGKLTPFHDVVLDPVTDLDVLILEVDVLVAAKRQRAFGYH